MTSPVIYKRVWTMVARNIQTIPTCFLLRGSRKRGASCISLFSALSYHVGLPLVQQAMGDTTKGITQVEAVLRQLVLQAGCARWMPS